MKARVRLIRNHDSGLCCADFIYSVREPPQIAVSDLKIICGFPPKLLSFLSFTRYGRSPRVGRLLSRHHSSYYYRLPTPLFLDRI